MSLAKISPKGQILIPKRIRNKCGVKPGGKMHILEQAEGVLLKPVPEDPLETACVFLKCNFSLSNDLLKDHLKDQNMKEPVRI